MSGHCFGGLLLGVVHQEVDEDWDGEVQQLALLPLKGEGEQAIEQV